MGCWEDKDSIQIWLLQMQRDPGHQGTCPWCPVLATPLIHTKSFLTIVNSLMGYSNFRHLWHIHRMCHKCPRGGTHIFLENGVPLPLALVLAAYTVQSEEFQVQLGKCAQTPITVNGESCACTSPYPYTAPETPVSTVVKGTPCS